jgi:hypothetical protein
MRPASMRPPGLRSLKQLSAGEIAFLVRYHTAEAEAARSELTRRFG